MDQIRGSYDPLKEGGLLQGLRKLLNDYKVTFDIYFGKQEMTLPINIRSRLLEFLLIKPDEQINFDCCSFVHYLNDITRPEPKLKNPRDITSTTGSMDFAKWNIRPFRNDEEMKPGDTFAIVELQGSALPPRQGLPDNAFPKHWYMFLGRYQGKDLYISKMNNRGPVAITSLEELVRIYKKSSNRHFVYKAVPVKRFTKGGYHAAHSSS